MPGNEDRLSRQAEHLGGNAVDQLRKTSSIKISSTDPLLENEIAYHGSAQRWYVEND